jgi:hypothetical protein
MTEAAVSFACNLTDHPEVRYTQSGIARAVFRVAVSGRREQEPSFFTVVAWRDQAEHATRSLAKAAGPWWSVGPSSAPGRRGMGAPGRSRSWPRSWAPACGGRPPRRPGRPGRAEPGGLPGHHRRLPPRQEPVINVTSRRCPRSPTDRFTAPGVSATIPLSSHPTIIRLGRQVRRQEALRWISATRSSSSLRWSPASRFLCLVCLGCSTVAGPGSAHHTARMRSTGTAMGSLVFLGGSSLAAGTAAPEEADGSPTGRPGPAWCLAC